MSLTSFRTSFQPFITTTQSASIAPTLNLNFVAGDKIDPRITFTRSGSSTRFNRYGLMENAASDVPRIDYDPNTSVKRGLLIESAKTNFLLQSNNFNAANWTTVTAAVVKTQDQIGLDGTTSAWTLDDQSTLSDGAGIEQAVSITPSSTTNYCLSIWAKQGTAVGFDFYAFFGGNSTKGSLLRYIWSTDTLTVAAADGGGITPTIFGRQAYPNGWYRFYFVVNDANNGLNNSLLYRLYPARRDITFTGTTLFQRAQLEIGTYPSSYIPTTTTISARGSDNATLSGNYFSPWYNSTEGTMVSESATSVITSATTYPAIWSLDFNGASADRMSAYYVVGSTNTDIYFYYRNLGSTYGSSNGRRTSTNTFMRTATSFKANTYQFDVDGFDYAVSSSGSLPSTLNRLVIGSGDYSLDGWISQLQYYPKALTRQELRALSLL